MRFLASLFKRSGKPTGGATPLRADREARAQSPAAIAQLWDRQAFSPALLAGAQHSDPALARAAQQRLLELLENQLLDGQTLLQSAGGEEALALLAQRCLLDTLLPQLLALLSRDELLLALLEQRRDPQQREAIADKISDHSQFKLLQHKAKGRDKALYRLAKTRYQAHLEQQRLRDQQAASAQQLCESLEQHARSAPDSLFAAKLGHLRQRWSEYRAAADTATRQRAEQALLQAEQRLAQLQQQQQQDQEAAEHQRQRLDLEQHYQQLYRDICAAESDHSHFSARLQALATTAEQLHYLDNVQPMAQSIALQLSALQRDGSLSDQLERCRQNPEAGAIEALQQRITALPSDQPLVLQAQEFLRQQLLQQQSAARAQRDDSAKLQLLLKQAQQALRQGQSKKAKGIQRRLLSKIAQLDELPTALKQRIEQLQSDIEQIQDWQRYAIEPKLETLIAQMRELGDGELAPPQLGQRINALQQQWKALTQGTENQYQAQWESFHALAQQAYQPCERYWAEQEQIRQNNVEKRRALIAQLEQFEQQFAAECEQGSAPNWDRLQQALNIAKQQWQQYSPCSKQYAKETGKSFDSVYQRLAAHLQQHYQQTIAHKQQLCEQIQALAAQADACAAARQAKQLQAQWRALGPTPRKIDQQLWQQFRRHCDTIFENRQLQQALNAQQQREQAQQAKQLLAQLEQLCSPALAHNAAAIEQLQQQLQACVAEQPGAAALGRRGTQLLQQYRSQLQQQQSAEQRQNWFCAVQISADIRRLESLQQSADAAQSASLSTQIGAQIDQLEQSAAELAALLRNRLQADHGASDTAKSDLREICIKLEIQRDLPSPPEDRALRMQLQMQALQARHHHATPPSARSDGEQTQQLLRDWIALRGCTENDAPMLARLAIILGMA